MAPNFYAQQQAEWDAWATLRALRQHARTERDLPLWQGALLIPLFLTLAALIGAALP